MGTAIYTQENRLMGINTALGEDELLLAGFSGEEGISRLFRFDLEMLSTNESVDYQAVVGQNATIRLTLAGGNERYFNGFISRFSQGGRDAHFVSYHAEMVPWLWFLTRTSDCRIFQDKKVPDIVTQIFGEYDFKDYKLQLFGDFIKREYCVQYRETDFNFISRLLEEEGIFYFFEHQNGVHTLVLANAPMAHQPCPEEPRVRYELSAGGWQEDDVVMEWRTEQQMRPGIYAQADYNFELPHNPLKANVEGKSSTYEIYEYHPGEYRKLAEGDSLVRTRLHEMEAPGLVAHGSSDCRAFSSGYRFELTDHYRADMNQDWVITTLRHTASEPGDFRSGSMSGQAPYYRNQFECIPYSTPFRPARVTPHPVVQGPQTAVVVGPKGEEIYVDKYGRVKVQFHWDREHKRDENSSCWIRVSQSWAGKKYGVIFIPRITQEVIVDFLEGDPDQPIISGRVYNADQMPPYPLPDKKVVSGIKTNSSKGGGGYNEMSMDDTKGTEKIIIHAQYDMETTVEHDDTQTVHNNRTIHVDGTHTETIVKDTTIRITEGKLEHDVMKGTAHYHVKDAVTEDFDNTQTTTVKERIIIQCTNAEILIDAKEYIELHTGDSDMVMNKDGSIRIDGKKIEIVGTEMIKLGVGNQTVTLDKQQVATAGAKLNSTAVGMHEISGALVKIN